MALFWVGLGSNLANPRHQLEEARHALAARFHELAAASLYESRPWGYVHQPNFLNTVIGYDGEESPQAILAFLLAQASRQGRQRTIVNGPRSLDLDLLHYEGQSSSTSDLMLPHPRLGQRAFVIVPWAEIAPTLILPDDPRPLAQRARDFSPSECWPLGD